ncbi:MAG: biotin--[acetyl-CoA-carboxylase] ligase [Bacteroidetes bacterium]|nr:biotin--[acetyl-CoA-carboxylase] ligase [Bacteroidota bacterium]
MRKIRFNLIDPGPVASTQQYLLELAVKKPLPEGTLIATLNQTAGKGQHGNQWESEAGKNLCFSFLLHPGFMAPSEQFHLNKMASLAVWHCLSGIPGIRSVLSVKWPNDIYVESRKIGGILITNSVMGNKITQTIIGIGLNINQEVFSPACPNPTSLLLESGTLHDPFAILDLFLKSFQQVYTNYLIDPEVINKQYLEVLYQFGQEKYYVIDNQKVKGRITGVSEYGKLQLEIRSKGQVECDIKEIQFL